MSRVHDLRHSPAMHLLREGVPVHIVSERLGHEAVAITLDFCSHVLPDMQQATVEAIAVGFLADLVNESVNDDE